jgi:hypothetical protein
MLRNHKLFVALNLHQSYMSLYTADVVRTAARISSRIVAGDPIFSICGIEKFLEGCTLGRI